MKQQFAILFSLLILFSCSEKGEDEITININVEDFSTIMMENPVPMQDIGTIAATTNLGTLSFTIVSQNPVGAFNVDENSGKLRVADETLYDFETNPTITGVVRVFNEDVFEDVNVTITLTNEDEPTLTASDLEITIMENPTAFQYLGTILGNSTGGPIMFEIVEQTPAGALSVGVNTGEIFVANISPFDYETNPTITGIVSLTNQIESIEVNVTINLTDEETIVTTSDLVVDMDENPLPNQLIGTVQGETNEGTLTFSIVNQSPNDAFTIDANTGELRVIYSSAYDYESNNLITGTVLVENGNVSATANITINILDKNACVESNQTNQLELYDFGENNTDIHFDYTFDAKIHEYTFTPNSNLNLCSVGYQAFDETPYQIELLDANGNIILNEMMTFSTTEQSEVILSSNISLMAGQEYTIRRTQNDYQYISDVIGYVFLNFGSGIDFPIVFNDITLVSSNLHDEFIDNPNLGFPFLTLGFE